MKVDFIKEYICVVCGVKFMRDSRRARYKPIKNCGMVCNGKATKKHGKSQSTLYRKYASIKKRCADLNYDSYGGKGIKCLWKSFDDFYNDMSESYFLHSKKYGNKQTQIDRIDNDGNYCKENCRWVTPEQNCYNKSNNVFIKVGRKKLNMKDISIMTGIKLSTIRTRYYRGLNFKEICKEPKA